MKIRSVNRLLLLQLIVDLLVGSLNSVLPGLPRVFNELAPKLLILAILLWMARRDGAPVLEVLPFRRTPWQVLLLTLLFYLVSWPLTTLANGLTLLFVSHLKTAVSSALETQSFLKSVLYTALIPAFYEECLIRGAVLQTYRKTGRVRAAVLMSAIIFGFFHANIAQLFYTAVMGLCLALIVEASGSLWTGILFHFVNNTVSILPMVFASDGSGDGGGGTLSEYVSTHIPFVLGFIALTVIGVLCFRPVLRAVRRYSGREDVFNSEPAEKISFRTPELVAFFALSIALIAATLPLFLGVSF